MDEDGMVAVEQAWNTAIGIVMANVRGPMMNDIMNEMRRMEALQAQENEDKLTREETF